MATNKQAIIRYKALDKCFGKTYKVYYLDDLKEVVEQELTDYIGVPTTVSRRQLFDDIKFMKSEGGFQAPIESYRSGKKVYYRYNPTSYSIAKQPLNAAELEQVQLTLETLGRVSGMPQFEWINSVQTKLSSGLKLDKRTDPVISFEENQFLKGLEHLEPLYQYIIHKQVLLIHYKGFKQEQQEETVIHPYYLKQYNNRWFLFGWNAKLEKIQNMALDRIISVEICQQLYRECEDGFFSEYFEDIVGVSNPEHMESTEVQLKFSAYRLPYVISKPIHGSQIVKDGVVYLDIKINRELISILLSFGKDLEVLSPASLKEDIRKEALGMLGMGN